MICLLSLVKGSAFKIFTSSPNREMYMMGIMADMLFILADKKKDVFQLFASLNNVSLQKSSLKGHRSFNKY